MCADEYMDDDEKALAHATQKARLPVLTRVQTVLVQEHNRANWLALHCDCDALVVRH